MVRSPSNFHTIRVLLDGSHGIVQDPLGSCLSNLVLFQCLFGPTVESLITSLLQRAPIYSVHVSVHFDGALYLLTLGLKHRGVTTVGEVYKFQESNW